MQIAQSLKYQWENFPLRSIIIIALALRLLASVFSQGYGMHDDHFIAIEEPWSWTQGEDYDGWLPGTKGEASEPSIYSFFYPGINYLLFETMHAIGIDNPKTKMFFIRLLHALFSLLTVYYGYKIAQHYSNDKNAKTVGLLLAIFWFMPFFGVRNLVEIIATPVLLASIWLVLKTNYLEHKKNLFFGPLLLAGLIAGLALSIRFQSVIFLGGIGLALLLQKRILQAIIFGIGGIIAFTVVQGIPDYFIWGEPFAVLKGYIEYNLAAKNEYGNQKNVFMYIELIPGLLIPPVGVFLFFGFFLKAKKHLLIFLPTLLFIAFHTYFPNRQERFILTIVPMVIILGAIGWNSFYEKSKWWAKHPKLYKGSYLFFWILNTILLVVVTFTYSKRSRVEAMHYFSKLDEPAYSVIIEDRGRKGHMMMPVFYAGNALNTLTITGINETYTRIFRPYSYIQYTHSSKVITYAKEYIPAKYVVFVEDINLEERVEAMKEYYPNLKFKKYIEPGLVDKIMKKLNPNNKNEDFYIYSTGN
jgi:hypothetical protein